MTTLLAISPHLDDAVFSAGALLAHQAAAGWRVVVATCFTANVEAPRGFALACQLDKGLGPEIDYMALRRDEDHAACALLGSEAVHLPFLEAPHRGYESPAALFGEPREEAGLARALEEALRELIDALRPACVLAPAAIGDHVDHRLVRGVAERVAGDTLGYWADLPYAARAGVPPGGFEPFSCGSDVERKRAACACYRSQLGFQFGGSDVPEKLVTLQGCEWFEGLSKLGHCLLEHSISAPVIPAEAGTHTR